MFGEGWGDYVMKIKERSEKGEEIKVKRRKVNDINENVENAAQIKENTVKVEEVNSSEKVEEIKENTGNICGDKKKDRES